MLLLFRVLLKSAAGEPTVSPLVAIVKYIAIMSQSNRMQLFDNWAKNYDADVTSPDNKFPHGGYDAVLDEVVRLADIKPHMQILDLGIGTGNLTARFFHKGCRVWGVDFSAEMLAKARTKLPQANLVQADLLDEWPSELQQLFDRVVSAYVLHEFDLETKVSLLRRIASHYLSAGGYILIADIAFPTTTDRAEASQRWANGWDEDEYYWAADEAIDACEQAGLRATYKQVSSCGGVFTLAIRGAG
jgi:putative AdoMet-dependent methyltransferase